MSYNFRDLHQIREEAFILREKVTRNQEKGNLINKHGVTPFEKFCPSKIPPFPLAHFSVSKYLGRPKWVQKLIPLATQYKLQNLKLEFRSISTKLFLN